ADSPPGAHNAIAEAPPPALAVGWADAARVQAEAHGQRLGEPLAELIEQCLAQDPRPAYQAPTPERRYGVRLWDVEVHWHYPTAEQIRVLDVTAAS
ncbi:MAG TPA: tRNA (N6-threonylcarbamoyladenosine(37)-N6)-methyltransferase TrmO, partial [Pseudomonas oryzihabitans]|nr:tRNA (N6-threonylcarbamoyladenosine(37)-N6)-methyltransferase TrmO [Pseudomonas oryzihabitans]